MTYNKIIHEHIRCGGAEIYDTNCSLYFQTPPQGGKCETSAVLIYVSFYSLLFQTPAQAEMWKIQCNGLKNKMNVCLLKGYMIRYMISQKKLVVFGLSKSLKSHDLHMLLILIASAFF